MSYHNKFTEAKPDKDLHWLYQLGTVELEIELTDRKLAMEVTPLQAAIVECFKNSSKHPLNVPSERIFNATHE